jgi:uncharacterized protein
MPPVRAPREKIVATQPFSRGHFILSASDNPIVEFRFAVRAKPGAKKDRVGGCWGENALIVAVAAPAIEGKANEKLRAVLAKAFGVRKADVSVVAGERGRDKIVELSPAPTDAAERLNVLLVKSI